MLVFQIFLPVCHEGKWIVFCINMHPGDAPNKSTVVFQNKVDPAVCLGLFKKIISSVEQAMNDVIGSRKVVRNLVRRYIVFNHTKLEHIVVEKETPANTMLPAMSFLESYETNGSFQEIDEASYDEYLLAALGYVLFHKKNEVRSMLHQELESI